MTYDPRDHGGTPYPDELEERPVSANGAMLMQLYAKLPERLERQYGQALIDAIVDNERLRAALDLALARLGPLEPGHSCAVSNEFVAMAAVQSACADEACMKVINSALARSKQ